MAASVLGEQATKKESLSHLLDHVSYSWNMLLFFYSEFNCETKLAVHKIYISKLFLWNNHNSVTIYLVSNDSVMCF